MWGAIWWRGKNGLMKLEDEQWSPSTPRVLEPLEHVPVVLDRALYHVSTGLEHMLEPARVESQSEPQFSKDMWLYQDSRKPRLTTFTSQFTHMYRDFSIGSLLLEEERTELKKVHIQKKKELAEIEAHLLAQVKAKKEEELQNRNSRKENRQLRIFQKQKDSALSIQTQFRVHSQRQKYLIDKNQKIAASNVIRNKVLQTQSCKEAKQLRGDLARKRQESRACIKVQSLCRKNIAKEAVKTIKKDMIIENASINIQSAWRGKSARVKVIKMKKENDRQNRMRQRKRKT